MEKKLIKASKRLFFERIKVLKIALLTVAYPPLKSSAAVQMKALADEFVQQGHQPYVFFPDGGIKEDYRFENEEGIIVFRFKLPMARDKNYVVRFFLELLMPFIIWQKFLKYGPEELNIEHIICFSPSIFFGPLIRRLKAKYCCNSYLILRDIFPAWAVDLGLIKRGSVSHRLLSFIEKKLYETSDIIGVQSKNNLSYFLSNGTQLNKIEVLNNWYRPFPLTLSSNINIENTKLAGKIIFVYAGNFGIAQGLDNLVDLLTKFKNDQAIGFVFIGRGSQYSRLKKKTYKLKINNILFYPEVSPEVILSIYDQCNIGLVCLDRKHTTHNVPGKFVSYMDAGLPVFAFLNPGNDLFEMISANNVGIAVEAGGNYDLRLEVEKAIKLLKDKSIRSRCKTLARKEFSTENVAKQIVDSLSKAKS